MTSSPLMIRPLAGLRWSDLPEVGGKAAGLGPLVDRGLPVPPGFVVTTAAYDVCVARNLHEQIAAELAACSGGETTHAAAAERLGILIESLTLPTELAEQICRAYADLGSPPVAVRSSATAEDLADASFAGLQDTFLNVRGEDELIRAVRACWASLWSEPAMAYRATKGLDGGGVAMGVVVQELVPARRAGVAFSADPITGNRRHVVVEGTWGLGEALVSGQVTPDRVVLQADTGRVLERKDGTHHVRTVLADTGVDLVATASAQVNGPVIDPQLAQSLTRLTARVVEVCGGPTDLEWAEDDQRVWITQARPITALPADVGDAVWSRETLIERYPDPMTPFTWSVVSAAFFTSLQTTLETMGGRLPEGDDLVRQHQGRGYLNVTAFDQAMASLPMRPPVTDSSETSETTASAGRSRPPVTGAVLASVARMGQLLLTTHRAWERAVPPFKAAMNRSRSVEPVRPGEDARARAARLLANKRKDGQAIRPLLDNHAATLAATDISLQLLTTVTRSWLGDVDGHLATRLLSGLSGNESVRTNQALWTLARQVADQEELSSSLRGGECTLETLAHLPGGSEFVRSLDHFLAEFGHRSPRYELQHPTWVDDPTQVLQLVALLLQAPTTEPLVAEAQQRERREQAERAARAQLSAPKRAVFAQVLRLAQTYFRLRENQQFFITMGVPSLRAVLNGLGLLMVDRGWLERAEDIYFLTEAEVEALGQAIVGGRTVPLHGPVDVAAVVGRRRRELDRWAATDPGLRLGGVSAPAAGSADLRGTAASAGTATGRVRVLHGPDDFASLAPGEILVAPATTPAWTPLFGIAAALITEYGGLLSHSGVMAREYGLPAAVGVTGALAALRTGQLVAVDGSTGTVTVVESNDSARPTVRAGIPGSH